MSERITWMAITHDAPGRISYVKTEDGHHVGYAFSEKNANLASAAPELMGVAERSLDVYAKIMAEMAKWPMISIKGLDDLITSTNIALAKACGETVGPME